VPAVKRVILNQLQDAERNLGEDSQKKSWVATFQRYGAQMKMKERSGNSHIPKRVRMYSITKKVSE